MPSNESVAYLLVNNTTGVIAKSGVTTMFDVTLQVEEGHTVILNPDDISDDTHYWNGEEFALYPSLPNDMHVWTGTEWADLRSPEEIIEQSQQELVHGREAAIAQVNAIAGKVRRLYVTDIPGQEALYLLKENAARSWLSANDPSLSDYPLIAAEVGPVNHVIEPGGLDLARGEKTRARESIAAIRVLRTIQQEGRPASSGSMLRNRTAAGTASSLGMSRSASTWLTTVQPSQTFG